MRLGAAIMVTMTASAADQSVLRPSGPQAAHIHWLWDVMLWTTGVIYVVVLLALFAGAWRRRRATDPTTMTDATGTAAGFVHEESGNLLTGR